MKITFCGGAREVGATCYLLHIDNRKLLIDCCIRMKTGKDTLPAFPVYVDGMVQYINQVYNGNPNYLREALSTKIFRNIDIFYDDNVKRVLDRAMRETIVRSSESLCVVASSGMLAGGPSAYYAEQFAADKTNYIAITGYQDEKAPTRSIRSRSCQSRGMASNPSSRPK
ncbi:MAG: hypothetical protein GF398_21565 [Chitinivibrionales bacterium]|nr:hypothetical protein [Chitinivibrionales bacterium]